MNSSDIIHVTENNFQYEVIQYSHQIPVVVDFWAEWCGPCRILDPILQRIAREEQGAFRLAKVDVDENPKLAMRYDVRGIPSVKGFREGQVVAEFSGAQTEQKVREFIRKVIPSISDLNLEKAKNLLGSEQWKQAAQIYQQLLQERPEEPQIAVGLAKSLIAQGQGRRALEMLSKATTPKEYETAQKLTPLAKALANMENQELIDDPLTNMYHHTLRLISLGNLPAALDGLLELLRKDKGYRDGEVQQIVLGIFEILGEDNPVTRQYRNELASILF
jgi:putative thioredoxin